MKTLGPDPMPSATAWLGRNAMGRRYVARAWAGRAWGVRDEKLGQFVCVCYPHDGGKVGHPKFRAQRIARLLNGEKA